ncbi:helix-turn-helix domain-containing protein [Paenibacillus pinisoli]|uniref:Helix-turn-helix domain-containing protein n=1 Tax=Paenibacillus pinisoli TaxID=1276110 RepID=A0A3A6PHB4_9BACL|nr:helix-turn-helix domain-containing protein [Paenibacillus pinisoli]RJX37549.1 helix-turn-helix domain-containing protein [Paenibacillus pinisoli]
MYKAVLVDDEPYDLIGMQKLVPWHTLGVELVLCTGRSTAALRYIQNHKIDLLITDIKMPIMSGIELARLSIEVQPALKTLFISGHQNFDFAKQALHLKADGYLLKPVDEREIAEKVRMILTDLEEERQPERTMPNYSLIRQDMLRRLLEGTMADDTLHKLLDTYMPVVHSGPYYAVLIEIDHLDTELDNHKKMDGVLLQFSNLLRGMAFGFGCRLSVNRGALVYAGSPDSLEETIDRIRLSVQSQSDFTLTAAYGSGVRGLNELPQSYREAAEAIESKMFAGKNRLIPPGHIKLAVHSDSPDVKKLTDELLDAVTRYRLVAVCDTIDELYNQASVHGDPAKIRRFTMLLMTRLEDFVQDNGEYSLASGAWGYTEIAAIERLETIGEIKSWLRKTAFELSETMQQKEDANKWPLLPDIEQYVQSRLSSDISLKETADAFSYSQSHFSYLFKEHAGISFSDYLVRERMKRAKELLLSPGLKIYEVAERVGYNSLTYFSRAFKTYAGMSPGDYRKRL